ncbi:hypothetical protein M404DRAFT_1006743 [Pisolithus tinctorius Marx 270]|uniref:Uncharacterized protein n=1 Tax=Pisolithus tinctorius Marx 270 TaxID=870435 RepID=A0A0C3NMC6_PISTI|nr:hypothetical protein M404DRAFT_1006743 [Pisolithus tinctorius Marx 270]
MQDMPSRLITNKLYACSRLPHSRPRSADLRLRTIWKLSFSQRAYRIKLPVMMAAVQYVAHYTHLGPDHVGYELVIYRANGGLPVPSMSSSADRETVRPASSRMLSLQNGILGEGSLCQG